ncbi:MAG: ABC transporter permease [Deltaproteobacteria bacterium]|nr:ABC transporter permease [Deltaproteobacteria bacterium]
MLTIIKMAWRNIWRNPRRTLLTILGMVVAATTLVFFVGLQLSSWTAAINAAVSIYHGHLQIQARGYLESPSMELTIENPNDVSSIVRTIPNIVATSVRAHGFALVSSAKRSYGVQLNGVEATREPVLSTIPKQIVSGRYLQEGDYNTIVIGAVLARNLRVKVGRELTLLGQAFDGSLAATVVDIVGIFETGSADIDRNMASIPLNFFSETYSMENRAHSIVVLGASLDGIPFMQAAIQNSLRSLSFNSHNELVALRWDELLPGLKQAAQLDIASGWLFYSTLVLVVAFAVLNTFLMSTIERTHEFGVMLAIGANRGILGALIIVECVLLSIVALAIGVTLGALILWYYKVFGFSIPGSEEIMKQWNLPTVIRPQLSVDALTLGPGLILLSSLLAALFPAWHVQRIPLMDALRR